MGDSALHSLAVYSAFVAHTLNRPNITRSTVAVWSDSPCTGIAEGEVFFAQGLRLRMREELDFDTGLITSYGYEVYETKNGYFGTTTFLTRMISRWHQLFLIINIFRPTFDVIVFQLPR